MDLEDFKSFCWASSASGVGSIPTRSRQRGAGAAFLALLMGCMLLWANLFASAAHAASQASPADSSRASGLATLSVDSTRASVADSAHAAVVPLAQAHRGRGAEGDTLAGGIGRSAPSRVMFRSLLVPGWGQLYNRKWWKAGIAISGQGALLGAYLVQDHLARTRTDATARAQAIDARQAALWFYAGAALVSMIDAYVDAHLFTFGKEFAPVEVRLTPAASPVTVATAATMHVTCAVSVGF